MMNQHVFEKAQPNRTSCSIQEWCRRTQEGSYEQEIAKVVAAFALSCSVDTTSAELVKLINCITKRCSKELIDFIIDQEYVEMCISVLEGTDEGISDFLSSLSRMIDAYEGEENPVLVKLEDLSEYVECISDLVDSENSTISELAKHIMSKVDPDDGD